MLWILPRANAGEDGRIVRHAMHNLTCQVFSLKSIKSKRKSEKFEIKNERDRARK